MKILFIRENRDIEVKNVTVAYVSILEYIKRIFAIPSNRYEYFKLLLYIFIIIFFKLKLLKLKNSFQYTHICI